MPLTVKNNERTDGHLKSACSSGFKSVEYSNHEFQVSHQESSTRQIQPDDSSDSDSQEEILVPKLESLDIESEAKMNNGFDDKPLTKNVWAEEPANPVPKTLNSNISQSDFDEENTSQEESDCTENIFYNGTQSHQAATGPGLEKAQRGLPTSKFPIQNYPSSNTNRLNNQFNNHKQEMYFEKSRLEMLQNPALQNFEQGHLRSQKKDERSWIPSKDFQVAQEYTNSGYNNFEPFKSNDSESLKNSMINSIHSYQSDNSWDPAEEQAFSSTPNYPLAMPDHKSKTNYEYSNGFGESQGYSNKNVLMSHHASMFEKNGSKYDHHRPNVDKGQRREELNEQADWRYSKRYSDFDEPNHEHYKPSRGENTHHEENSYNYSRKTDAKSRDFSADHDTSRISNINFARRSSMNSPVYESSPTRHKTVLGFNTSRFRSATRRRHNVEDPTNDNFSAMMNANSGGYIDFPEQKSPNSMESKHNFFRRKTVQGTNNLHKAYGGEIVKESQRSLRGPRNQLENPKSRKGSDSNDYSETSESSPGEGKKSRFSTRLTKSLRDKKKVEGPSRNEEEEGEEEEEGREEEEDDDEEGAVEVKGQRSRRRFLRHRKEKETEKEKERPKTGRSLRKLIGHTIKGHKEKSSKQDKDNLTLDNMYNQD